jgi:hypothetical protein
MRGANVHPFESNTRDRVLYQNQNEIVVDRVYQLKSTRSINAQAAL